IGAGLKWTLWDWARTRNEKQVVALQKTVLEGRRQELADHIRRALDAKKAEIASLGALLETDSSLIALRRRITATAESQYANGVVTATDYLQELHAEQQALINHEIHRISLLLARVEYLHITGRALP
ncbi:MAG TPA: TolC family protein, partial [Prolixibacteraceae bacterium]|nr:TolC family protein [Prolixibacteraceae bacterium]